VDKAVAEALKLGQDDTIQWLSPLETDAPPFEEYQDGAFLECLGVSLPVRHLEDFWPARGPSWDGLARTSRGRCLLVEAKANIREFNSPGTGAKGRSLGKIKRALDETRDFLQVKNGADWTSCFYQYANRLAHLYLLKELNKVDAALVFVYFVGDSSVPGQNPVSREGWLGAIDLAMNHLGVRPHSPWMRESVFDVFIDVDELSHIPWP
jgi:hypothetical protein